MVGTAGFCAGAHKGAESAARPYECDAEPDLRNESHATFLARKCRGGCRG